MPKYRIVEDFYIGEFSGKIRKCYNIEKKAWIGWWVIHRGLDSIEFAEELIAKYRRGTVVVKEII